MTLLTIANNLLRGFTPPSTKSCLLVQGGVPGVGRDRWRSPQGVFVGAGRLNAAVIRDKSRQKRGVISAVWVPDCRVCGLNVRHKSKRRKKEVSNVDDCAPV